MPKLDARVPATGALDALEAAYAASGPQLPSWDRKAVSAQLRGGSWTRVAPYHHDTIHEGRAFRLEVGLGTVALRSWDPARAEARRSTNPDLPVRPGRPGGTYEWNDGHSADARDVIHGTAQWAGLNDPGSHLLRPAKAARSRVREWSRKSRARMLRAFAELDYRAVQEQPGVAAMVTLTYPGEWLSVAPTFAASKRHLRLLMKRWAREFGYRPAGLWKLEFQRRGAPHYHLFVSVPYRARDGRTFERWLSDTWAAVVDHQDPEQRRRHVAAGTGVDFGAASTCTDARRLAVYFLKHGTKTTDGKEYQNAPPLAWDIQADMTTGEVVDDGGTGRFWGYWGMKRERAAVDVSVRDYYNLRRLLRRWAKSQGRTVRGLGARGGNAGGWQLVNDGARFAAQLSAALAAAG